MIFNIVEHCFVINDELACRNRFVGLTILFKNAKGTFFSNADSPKEFCRILSYETSMMWPSQNFLLYIRNIIKMKVTEWINNLKKYVNPPPLGIYTTYTNYNNLISKKSKRF